MRSVNEIIGEIAVLPDDESEFQVTRLEMVLCENHIQNTRPEGHVWSEEIDRLRIPSYLECMGHRLVERAEDSDGV